MPNIGLEPETVRERDYIREESISYAMRIIERTLEGNDTSDTMTKKLINISRKIEEYLKEK